MKRNALIVTSVGQQNIMQEDVKSLREREKATTRGQGVAMSNYLSHECAYRKSRDLEHVKKASE